jgi:hypothetical protein
LQRPLIEPFLRWCWLANTAFDILFYDVGLLTAALMAKGTMIDTEASTNSISPRRSLATLDLTAQTNPSGSIIIVDSNLAPYIGKPFLDMKEFFEHANGLEGAGVHTLTVTGVGSSAFGSVAFAWDASVALGEPVAAIVPGYGLADVVPQALGGWFGFEQYDALQSATQDILASFAPTLAIMGKDLARRRCRGEIPARRLGQSPSPGRINRSSRRDTARCFLFWRHQRSSGFEDSA